MMTKLTYIYELSKNDIPFYVGKTVNPITRQNDHRQKFGKNTILTVIDTINSIDKNIWEPIESYWINQYKSWGFSLENKNNGGNGTSCRKPETTEKIIANSDYSKRKNNPKFNTKQFWEPGVRDKIDWDAAMVKWKQHPNNINKDYSYLKTPRKPETTEKIVKKLYKPIIQRKNGQFIAEFDSIKSAVEKTGIKSIKEVLCGKQHHAGGYQWEYKK